MNSCIFRFSFLSNLLKFNLFLEETNIAISMSEFGLISAFEKDPNNIAVGLVISFSI